MTKLYPKSTAFPSWTLQTLVLFTWLSLPEQIVAEGQDNIEPGLQGQVEGQHLLVEGEGLHGVAETKLGQQYVYFTHTEVR